MSDIINYPVCLELTPRENGKMLLYTSLRLDDGKWLSRRLLIEGKECSWDIFKQAINESLDAMKEHRQEALSNKTIEQTEETTND